MDLLNVVTVIFGIPFAILLPKIIEILVKNPKIPMWVIGGISGYGVALVAAALYSVIYNWVYTWFYCRPEAYESPQSAAAGGTIFVGAMIAAIALIITYWLYDWARELRRDQLRRVRHSWRS